MEIKTRFTDPAMLIGQGQKPESTAGGKNDPEALRRTGQQFEAIFIQQLFKGMRATVPDGELLESDRSIEIFQDLMDRQVSEEMARRQGLGVAEALMRQLGEKKQE